MSEEINIKKRWYYNTQVQMNRPLRLAGFKSLQLGLILGMMGISAVVVISIAGFIGFFFVEGIIVLPVILLSRKLQIEQKKGNYDFINSYMSFTSTPKKILDKNRCLKFLIKT
jgi:hypothetical protein